MKVHQFWYGKELPLFAIESMTRIHKYGYIPVLWTYNKEKPTNVPSFVSVKNANDVISFKYFSSRFLNSNLTDIKGKSNKKKYYSAAIFSDVFRAKLLHMHGGWWFDTDVMLLKKLPNVKEVVSTLPRKLEGVFARKVPHFENVPLGDVNSSIMKAPQGSPWVANYLSKMINLIEHHHLSKKPLKSNIDLLLLLPTVLPKGVAAHPTLYNPLPVWTSKMGVTSFGYKIPTLDEIARKSYTLSLSGPLLKSRYLEILKFIDNYKK